MYLSNTLLALVALFAHTALTLPANGRSATARAIVEIGDIPLPARSDTPVAAISTTVVAQIAEPAPTSTPSGVAESTTTASPGDAPSMPDKGGIEPTPSTPAGLTLYQQLALAPNAVSRLALLKDEGFIFKLDNPLQKEGVATSDGGFIVRADHATFPALVAQGGALAIGFLGPCGFNTPHIHPRAAELNLVIEGHLFANVVAENGARFLNHTLSKFEMTVFPQGAVHTEFNPDCTPSVFVAAFPHEDPGVGQITQEYFGLTDEIVKGSAGGEVSMDAANIDAFRSKIPANVAKGVDSCLQRCGIAKK